LVGQPMKSTVRLASELLAAVEQMPAQGGSQPAPDPSTGG
jgi:hypothetical protein